MKLSFIAAAAVAAALFTPAYAGDQEDAKANCIALGQEAMAAENMPADQKALADKGLESMCGCMTEKLAGLGDDGAKVLRVLVKTTPEMAKASSETEGGDRKNAIAVLMAEYGLSEAEAGEIYDRVDPQVNAIGQQCQAEMMKAMSGQ